jgi:hypothetical protein
VSLRKPWYERLTETQRARWFADETVEAFAARMARPRSPLRDPAKMRTHPDPAAHRPHRERLHPGSAGQAGPGVLIPPGR